jgi:hypothetical protein
VHAIATSPTIDTALDRRGHQRFLSHLWGDLAIGLQRIECYVYDVSLGGAKLLAFGSIALPRELRLFVPPFGVFECEVRWSDGPFIGVQFGAGDRARAIAMLDQVRTGTPQEPRSPVAPFGGGLPLGAF